MKKLFLPLLLQCLLPALASAQCCDFINSNQSLGTDPTFGVALGDLDGDGDNDAVTIDAYLDIEIYFNNGTGMFSLAQTIVPAAGEEDNFGVNLADVDGDTDLDAIVIPFYSSASLKIYKNDGSGNLSLFQTVSSNTASRYAGLADLDGDLDVDIFLPADMSGTTKVFKNNGSGFYTQFSTISISSLNDVVLVDVDSDLDKDAIVVSDNSMAAQVLLNDGNGNFINSGMTYGDPDDNYFAVAAGDINKDGYPDFIIGGMYCDMKVFINNGSGSFLAGDTLPSSNYDMHMKMLDFDADSDPDLFVSTYGSDGLELWKNNGESHFSLCFENSPPMPQTYAHGFDIAKLNNDGFYDAYMGQFGSSGDQVFYGSPLFYTIIVNADICPGQTYTFPNGATGDTTMVNISQLSTLQGCDSTIITNLSLVIIDTGLILSGNTITSQALGASYLWVDCLNNYAPLPGAVNQSFTPSVSGTYAVIIIQGNCLDTSACIPVTITSLQNVEKPVAVIYPNPAGDEIRMEYNPEQEISFVYLTDIAGRIIRRATDSGTGQIRFDISAYVPGVYLLKVVTVKNGISHYRFIKN